MYYRQFSESDSPIHLMKVKDGSFIPTTARSTGTVSLGRMNSYLSQTHGQSSGSITGRGRSSFSARRSFGPGGSVSREGSFGGRASGGSVCEFPMRPNGSFSSASGKKRFIRNSFASVGGVSLNQIGGGDNLGDMTNRSGHTARGLATRSQSQIVSQVRVKSFRGTGPAPRMIKLATSAGNIDEIARFRYLSEHEDDVQGMQNFFRRAGLSMQKSVACAEESVCLDANTPRKLFKYVHEVQGFSLIELGMDEIDMDMVLDALNLEFSYRDLSAESAAAAAVAKMMGTTQSDYGRSTYGGSEHGGNGFRSSSGFNLGGGTGGTGMGSEKSNVIRISRGDDESDTTDEQANELRTGVTTASMIVRQRPDDSAKAKYIADHENDVLDMQEFFRFAGLSIQLSRHCAEESIFMEANSPKKLFKYLKEVKGFILTDLGMDPVDADMVYETLKREFGVSAESASKRRYRSHRRIPLEMGRLDYKSDSSDDYDDVKERKSVPVPRQPADEPSPGMRQSAQSLVQGLSPLKNNSQSQSQPKGCYNQRSEVDHHDAFEAEVAAALESQQRGSQSRRSSDSVSTLGMKSEAETYYHIDQASLHSLGVAVALNKLPPRPSSGMPGQKAARDAVKAKEKLHDLKDSLSQATTAADIKTSGIFANHWIQDSASVLGLTLCQCVR